MNMDNVNKEMETLKKNQKELLEVNKVTKNVFDGLIRELDTAEEIW